ncbi:MAG: hypothetical protein Q9220_000404 [cf. Caloplaca sp. 1 TL-2023]
MSFQQPSPTMTGPQLHSCVTCQRRKVKCDRYDPCSNCTKHRATCEFRSPAPPRRRKRTSPDPDLYAKVKRYEGLLQARGVKVEELNSRDRTQSPNYSESPSAKAGSTASTAGRHNPETPDGKQTAIRSTKKPQERHLEELLEGSDDESRKQGPGLIGRALDKMHHGDGSGLLFGFNDTDDIKSLHPPHINIFRLWQTYLNCVYPMTMLFHAPTVQQQILDASSDLESVSESMEALMFAIYYAAVVALTPEECELMFGTPQPVVVKKYMFATQRALNAAKLLKSLDLTVLQALVIFLNASRHMIDPRSLWIHCGIAVRLGQRVGLHRDGTLFGLPPFETEMRRRLWWQIIVLDSRVSELSGAGTSILNLYFDTNLPSNVNDSNLNSEMGETPMDHPGATDMTFCLSRYEIAHFMKRSNTVFFSFDGPWAKSDGEPATIMEKDSAIDELERRLEDKYLKHCDPQITLHFLTKIFSRTAVYRMRLVAHHPRLYADKGASMPQEEKDLLCRLSLNMIENDNICHRNKSADRFAWFVNSHFQFPAFVYLISELRHRTRGELAERGWAAVNEGFQNRVKFIVERKQSPMFKATSALALKAWQAHDLDMRMHGEPAPEPPEYILTLRSIFGEPPAKSRKDTEGNDVYLHTPADSTTQSDVVERASKMPPSGNGDTDSAHTEPGNNPTEWSPMDWAYWDELIHDWEPQVPDGSALLSFDQTFGLNEQ